MEMHTEKINEQKIRHRDKWKWIDIESKWKWVCVYAFVSICLKVI